jgi:DNA/RNA non-specific endonuclease
MSPQEWRRRGKSAFEIYLRTGAIATSPSPGLALKYNPWHDTDDGRFTQVGMGRKVPPKFGGFGGGGDGFDGGGASGSWNGPDRPKPKPKPPIVPKQHVVVPGMVIQPKQDREAQKTPASSPSPIVQTIQRNGYAFGVDALFRTRSVTGSLTLGPRSERSRSMQSNAGKPDRQPKDDGGLCVATRFNGPREKFNHFAQDSNVNRGRYKALENQWARDLARGKKVVVDIRPRFTKTSVRPYEIDIIWRVGKDLESIKIPNGNGK